MDLGGINNKLKKLLGIIFLGLLLSGNAYANCRNDVTLNWSVKENRYVRFEFLNSSNRVINIYSYGILTADKQIIKKNKELELNSNSNVIQGVYLRAFGREQFEMYVTDINTKLIRHVFYKCKYLK